MCALMIIGLQANSNLTMLDYFSITLIRNRLFPGIGQPEVDLVTDKNMPPFLFLAFEQENKINSTS